MTTAEDPKGPWTPLHLVKEVKGWIDPCPFWDENGEAYLIHAFAKSRTGIKHKLKLCRMSEDGKGLLDDGEVIYDGEADHPTMEGPKLYKRNGYYYIFAPAGGVPTGWQTILRSRSITGPYEDKMVLHQGDTEINGPHQGGYVELSSGESWFVHFQDREAYGRIVHLQPIRWENDWPEMGIDSNDDGIGEPVLMHKKPNVGREWPITVPSTSDEFESPSLGLHWQWQANWKHSWYSLKDSPSKLRLYAEPLPIGVSTLYQTPNVLCQKLPAPAFTATAKLTFRPGTAWDRAGFTVFGHEYRYIAMSQADEQVLLTYVQGRGSKDGSEEEIMEKIELPAGVNTVYFKVSIVLEVECSFAYSVDGDHFVPIGDRFIAVPGGWVGAKLGLFCLQQQGLPGGGYVDVDWFRVNEQ